MKPMLAVSVELGQIEYPVYVSAKLDGIRCLGTDDGPRTRSLKPIPNRYVRNMLSDKLFTGFDGELIIGDPTADDVFNKTTSGVMSSEGRPDFTWYVFDAWDLPTNAYYERLHALETREAQSPWKNTSVLIQRRAETEEELVHWEEHYLSAGYEGVILRKPTSLYKYGRSTVRQQYLLKRKPLADAEGVVVDFRYLEHNNNEATKDAVGKTVRSNQQANQEVDYYRVGALEVEVLNGPFQGATVSIGTGFTDAQRQQLLIDGVIGKIVTFTYQASGSMVAPRFPSFKGIRKDL